MRKILFLFVIMASAITSAKPMWSRLSDENNVYKKKIIEFLNTKELIHLGQTNKDNYQLCFDYLENPTKHEQNGVMIDVTKSLANKKLSDYYKPFIQSIQKIKQPITLKISCQLPKETFEEITGKIPLLEGLIFCNADQDFLFSDSDSELFITHFLLNSKTIKKIGFINLGNLSKDFILIIPTKIKELAVINCRNINQKDIDNLESKRPELKIKFVSSWWEWFKEGSKSFGESFKKDFLKKRDEQSWPQWLINKKEYQTWGMWLKMLYWNWKDMTDFDRETTRQIQMYHNDSD